MVKINHNDITVLGFGKDDLKPREKVCMGLVFQTNGYKEQLNMVRKMKNDYEQNCLDVKGEFVEIDDALLYNGPINHIPEDLFDEDYYIDILDKLQQLDCQLCIIYWNYD